MVTQRLLPILLAATVLLAACTSPAPSSSAPPNPAVPGTPTNPADPSEITDSGLTLQEYALGKDRPDNIDTWKRLPEQVRTALNGSGQSARNHWGQPRPPVEELNLALKSWGFELVTVPLDGGQTAYNLMHQGSIVAGPLVTPVAFSRSDSGKRALLAMEPAGRGEFALWLDGKMRNWNPSTSDFVPPIFCGEDLLSLYRNPADPLPDATYTVFKEGVREPLFSFEATFGADSPIDGFYSEAGRWYLEYADHVVVDGKDLGAALGYDKVYNHRHLNGRPFYFFEKGGQVRASFDGYTLDSSYDEVAHNGCCEPAIANPHNNQDSVGFFARRGTDWLYVQATAH